MSVQLTTVSGPGLAASSIRVLASTIGAEVFGVADRRLVVGALQSQEQTPKEVAKNPFRFGHCRARDVVVAGGARWGDAGWRSS